MGDDNQDTRKKRAARLRDRIEGLKRGKSDAKPAEDEPRPRESARDFVHRRMREIDRDQRE